MNKIRFKKQMHTPQGKQWLDIDINFPSGELVSVFGESGAGKTTFLRILAGLTQPEEGYIEIEGEVWFDSNKKMNRSVQMRKIGFISQENTLFPHMTVRGNLEYAWHGQQDFNLIPQWIELVGLKGLEDKNPDQLSGGQKQRLALIRALIRQPKILLLDEPLSDLDIQARLNLQDEILKIYAKTKITTVLVSHDMAEVFKLAQKVFVLDRGKIIKSGKPQEIFVNNDVSGKFKFTGQILEIHQDGVLNILTLSIGNNVTKVVATDEEMADLKVGSQVVVSSKAFNPLILRSQKN